MSGETCDKIRCFIHPNQKYQVINEGLPDLFEIRSSIVNGFTEHLKVLYKTPPSKGGTFENMCENKSKVKT